MMKVVETEPRPDLEWDSEARGLCWRVYGNDLKAFIFLYRIDGRQRFIRIGKTPAWTLDAARKKAKKLRSIVDQGHDPANYTPTPVENIIEYIAEHLRMETS